MKRFLLIPCLVFAACADAPAADPETAVAATAETSDAQPDLVLVGATVPDGEALSTESLVAQADDLDGQTVLVEGTVEKVCQMAGCWLTFTGEDGVAVRINVPRDDADNYVFTFPQGVEGRRARVAGTFTVEEESVEMLQHYAEDEGASPEEVAAITAPRRTLALEATGAELTPANA